MTTPDDIRPFITKTVAEQFPQIEPTGVRDWIAALVPVPERKDLEITVLGEKIGLRGDSSWLGPVLLRVDAKLPQVIKSGFSGPVR